MGRVGQGYRMPASCQHRSLLQKPVLIPVQTHLFMEAADERAVVICGASGEVAGNTVGDVQSAIRLHCVDPLNAIDPNESAGFGVMPASRAKHKDDE